MSATDADKRCPYCHEVIKASALKCRFCKEWLDPKMAQAHAAAERGVPRAVRVDGRLLHVPRGAEIPISRCALCGGAEAVAPWRKRFHGVAPHYVFRTHETITLPECAACRRARWIANAIGGPVIVVGVFLFPILGGVLGSAVGGDPGVGAGILGGLAAYLAAATLVHWVWFPRTRPVCKKIDEQGTATLRFPARNGLATLGRPEDVF